MYRNVLKLPGEMRPTGCASSILLVTSIYISLGVVALVAWEATGNVSWVIRFFRVPGALLLVWLAAIELWVSIRVRRHFPPGDRMHNAWVWIGLSALCQLLGAVCSQVLGTEKGINPLAHLPNWSAGTNNSFRELGLMLGGSLRYGLLAAGLFVVLQACRKAGVTGRLRAIDWLLVAAGAAYVGEECGEVLTAVRNGKHPGLWEVAGWPVDPLLVLILCEALLLHRSMRGAGHGWATRCWSAYAVGTLLVLVGDVGLWLARYGYLGWPSSSVVWYVWLPAACAFALAPTYQLETIYRAVTARGGDVAPAAT